jgi:hypothetical protein
VRERAARQGDALGQAGQAHAGAGKRSLGRLAQRQPVTNSDGQSLSGTTGHRLAAKVATSLGIGLLGSCLAVAVSQLAVVAARAAGRDIATGASWPQLAGCVVFILLTGTTGTAFGALLYNTAVAIVSYCALGAAFNLFTIPALEMVGRWVTA